jgi:general stress protein 26
LAISNDAQSATLDRCHFKVATTLSHLVSFLCDELATYHFPGRSKLPDVTLTDTIREFLQKPLVARMSTIDRNGYPHTVPVWFDVDGGDLIITSVRDTSKVRQIEANPKGAVQIGGGPGDGGGYLFKGVFSIEPDTGHAWINKMCYHYETKEQAEKDIADWADLDIIVLRLIPTKVRKV